MEYNKSDEFVQGIVGEASIEEYQKMLQEIAAKSGVTVDELMGVLKSSVEFLSGKMNRLADMMRELMDLNVNCDLTEIVSYSLNLIYYISRIINSRKVVNIIIFYNRWKLYWAKQTIGPD